MRGACPAAGAHAVPVPAPARPAGAKRGVQRAEPAQGARGTQPRVSCPRSSPGASSRRGGGTAGEGRGAAPGARPGGAGRGRTGRAPAGPAPWGRASGGGSVVAAAGAQLPARRRALCARTGRAPACLRPRNGLPLPAPPSCAAHPALPVLPARPAGT